MSKFKAFAVLCALSATLPLSILSASGKSGSVHVTGHAYRMQGGDYVEVHWPNGIQRLRTAYGQYDLDVPKNVIVTAKIRDYNDRQVSSVVAGSTADKSQGGDAVNNVLHMPNLSR